MNDTNKIANDDRQLSKKPSELQIDQLAAQLCAEYGNDRFFKWYCKAIHKLGIRRINELRAMCQDAKKPGLLFSKRVNEEMQMKPSESKLDDFRSNYGKIGH